MAKKFTPKSLYEKHLTKGYFSHTSLFAGVPEWSNGTASIAVSLVLTQVRVLSPALFFKKLQVSNTQKVKKQAFIIKRKRGTVCITQEKF